MPKHPRSVRLDDELEQKVDARLTSIKFSFSEYVIQLIRKDLAQGRNFEILAEPPPETPYVTKPKSTKRLRPDKKGSK